LSGGAGPGEIPPAPFFCHVVKKIVLILLFAASLVPARAVVLLNESFDYTNGPLITVSGGLWTHTSGTTSGELDVAAGVANLTGGEGEDVSAPLAGQPYPAGGTTNVFYAGFTVRFSGLPNNGGTYFAHFDGSGFRARVWALTGGAPASKFRLGLSSTTSTSANVTNLTDLALNTTYNLVVRLTNSTGVATLWINPASESDASVTTTEAAPGSTVSELALRQSAGFGTLAIDQLRVATTFGEVVFTNPPASLPPEILAQPADQPALPGEPVLLSVSASGADPLSYQWQFNGTNLTDATNSTLLLTNVGPAHSGLYGATVTNVAGATNTTPAQLTVLPLNTPFLSVMDYNTHGNGDPNWTTNATQVKAIGRLVMHLDPDIITFQEIPTTNNGLAQMTNFVTAFRPGFHLATNSGTDTYIHTVILSRWPITRSQSWLDGADLDPFGYTNANFTRDLFEAEISVPGFDQPLHVFTTHLKSGTSASADAARRAAEASAISNFFVTVFLPTDGTHPYLLTGDLNEDIAVPATGSQQPIQRLANAATGLHLTTPVNPFTGSELTFSIQSTNGLTRRYDYVMPCGLLYSNFAGAQIFRSDLLTNPPAPLLTNDTVVASDHLPVLMSFANPYGTPFRLLSVEVAGGALTLRWESVSNRVYGVEASADLASWAILASNLTATGTNSTFTTNAGSSRQFFRVYRLP
jgi:endonuclease/exonuclease/phosphatase family metal-dependent hydrolase